MGTGDRKLSWERRYTVLKEVIIIITLIITLIIIIIIITTLIISECKVSVSCLKTSGRALFHV